jgi:hypothetical protein
MLLGLAQQGVRPNGILKCGDPSGAILQVGQFRAFGMTDWELWGRSGPGPRLLESQLVLVEDDAPIVLAGDDIQIDDEEADNGLYRDSAGWQVELVKGQSVTGSVGMRVGPANVVT